MKQFFWSLLLCLVVGAALGAETTHGSAKVALFFPDKVANGTLRLVSSGVLLFRGNGWCQVEPGLVRLPLKWADDGEPVREASYVWSVELAAGRYVVGAELQDDGSRIVFTLRKEGQRAPFLRSAAIRLGRMERGTAKESRSEYDVD